MHVEYVEYRIEHVESADYDSAPDVRHCHGRFEIEIQRKRVRFYPHDHHADTQSAQDEVQQIVDAWELSVNLLNPGHLKLMFVRSHVIDRSPTPGVVEAVAIASSTSFGRAVAQIGYSHYPLPPQGLGSDADVRSVLSRYEQCWHKREPIASMAYFCLTVMTKGGSPRTAAQKYGIDEKVLRKIGELTATKGGTEARKAGGIAVEYTKREERWLRDAIKLLIQRRAEWLVNPAVASRKITLADFLSLP